MGAVLKTILFFLILVPLFAQDVITVGKGSGSYIYDVTTGTNQIINGDLYLYGNFSKTQTDTGAYSARYFIVWKYTGGTYDSSAALRVANSFLIRVDAPTLDETGTYYASILYRTQKGKGVWVYDRGVDSSFTTPAQIVPPDTVPVQFSYHDSTNAEFSTLVESNGITLIGLDSANAYAGGASFKVNAGSWSATQRKVYNNDVVYLRNTSSGACTTAVNTTLTVGGVSDVFSITTKLDNTPNAFTFTDVTLANTSTLYTSNQITVAGINCNSAISVNGGQFQINSNAWRSSATTVANGNLVRVRITSSANYNTPVTSILTIGGVQDTYTVTTRPDSTPSQFTFMDVNNASRDSLHYSNGVKLLSLDSCNASAGTDTFKVGALGAWFVGMKKVYGDDTIYLKNVSSGSYSTVESMTFSAGGTSDTWSITTMDDPTFAGNRWYVRPVTGEYGSEDGTSWTNAFDGVADIAWGSIEPGDFLYFSGGTDSAVYNQVISFGASGTKANRVIMIAGKYSPSPSGHSGRVIIDGNGLGSTTLHIQSKDYVTVKGMEFRNSEDLGIYIEDYCDYIIIDSCEVYDMENAGIFANGSGTYGNDSIIIKNCRVLTPLLYGGQTDGIAIQNTSRTWLIGNYVRQRNQDPLAHNDCVQGHLANGLVMYNNILISDSVNSPEGGGYAGILGWENTLPFIVYNNYMYMGGIWYLAGADSRTLSLRWYDNDPMPPSWVFNNTIISNGPKTMAAECEFRGTFINNILAQYIDDATGYTMSPIFGVMGTDPGTPQPMDSLRNNLFYRSWGASMFTTGYRVNGNGNTGYPTSWSDWQTTYGGTGVYAEDPLLVDDIGFEPNQGALLPDLQSGSPAINAGENLTNFINWLNTTYGLTGDYALPLTDINGNARDANWDIGAYEYIAP